MAVTAEQLAAELNALEQAAGRVGALLQKAPEELVEQALEGWAPAPPKCRIRATWNGYWLGWLERSAAMWQPCDTAAVSPEASLDLDVSSTPIENTSSRSCDEPDALMTPNASEYGPLISPVAVNCPAHSADHTGTPGSAQEAENAVWAWVLGGVQCSSGSGVD